MGMMGRADAYQRRHRWAGLPLAVVYKFFDDQGSYLAAQITYYGVVSLFPLLLLLTTFLGYGLHDSPSFQRQVLDSALAQFPVVGDQIATDGILARRLGYTFVLYDPHLGEVPAGPRLMGAWGKLMRPLLYSR